MKVYKSEKMRQSIHRTYDLLLAQWGVPVEELDLDTPYGMVHVIACGDKGNTPLVLFHGVGDDSALMWIYNAKYLSQHYRLYAVDTIGGPGKSVPGPGYNKAFDDVLWIDAILDQLSLEKACFAGVSHGGHLVQLYAACRSERMIKGVSIANALVVGGKGSSMLAMMKIFLPEALIPTNNNVRKLIEKLSGDNSAVFTENPVIMEHYTYLLRGFNNMAMGYHKVRAFTAQEADMICKKVTFLIGLEDPFQKLRDALAIKDERMHVTYYEHAGHGLNHEKAEEINAKIVEIFSE